MTANEEFCYSVLKKEVFPLNTLRDQWSLYEGE